MGACKYNSIIAQGVIEVAGHYICMAMRKELYVDAQ